MELYKDALRKGINVNAIITGATGFVGRALVEELLNHNWKVTVIARKEFGQTEQEKQLEIIKSDLSEIRNLKKKDFHNLDEDTYFFHLAWDGTSGNARAEIGLQLSNVEYACDALKLAVSLSCKKFIYAGSVMEYEAMNCIRQGNGKPGLGYIYSSAKLAADIMLRAQAVKYGIEYNNAVISNIYGPGEKSSRFLNTLLRKMLRNESMELTAGQQQYDFIYIEDAVAGIRVVAEKGSPFEAYYIGNEKTRKLKEFILEMKENLKSSSDLQFGKIPYNGEDLDYKKMGAKSLSEVDFMPKISFKEGILRTKKWIASEG